MSDAFIIAVFFAARFFPPTIAWVSNHTGFSAARILLDGLLLTMFAASWVVCERTAHKASHRRMWFRARFIGIRRAGTKDTAIGIITGAVLFALYVLCRTMFFLNTSTPQLPPIFTQPSWWVSVVMIVSAGVTEELFYRSYIIARLRAMKTNAYIIVVVSAVVFALGHTAGGALGMLFSLLAGIVFAVLLLARACAWITIIAHVTYNCAIYAWFLLM